MFARWGIVTSLVLVAACAEDRPSVAGTTDPGTSASSASSSAAATPSAGTTTTNATGSTHACGCIVPAGIITADLPCDFKLCIFDETHACIANATVLTTAGDSCTDTPSDAGVTVDAGGADAGGPRISPR